MKWFPVFALLTTLTASAAWEITGAEDLGHFPKNGLVRGVDLSDSGRTARLTAILFSVKTHELRVIDSSAPGSTKLESSLRGAGLVAGVNGGYFHENYRPVGLMIADGREIQPFERAKLLAGVLAVRGSRLEIVRSSKFSQSADLHQAIQCGPMLVENGHPTAGLNDTRNARRTIVATDGRGQWALIYLTSVTLADSARILTTEGLLGGWDVATALNLDGGSSSGLWAATSPEPVSLIEFGHVRNYIGLVPR